MEPHAAAGVFAGMGLLTMLLVPVFAIATFVLFIVSLIQIIKNDFVTDNDKTIWLLIVIFTGPLGQILYWSIGRNKIKRSSDLPSPPAKPTVKICSNCNSTMTIRERQSSEGITEAFWVCSRYSEGCKTFEKI